MAKLNCWELMNCGREPGGSKVAELGLCPATTDSSFDGLNGGKNGGRICWAVTGTFCGGKVQGTFAQKQVSCLICKFFIQAKAEEGTTFQMFTPGQQYKPHE